MDRVTSEYIKFKKESTDKFSDIYENGTVFEILSFVSKFEETVVDKFQPIFFNEFKNLMKIQSEFTKKVKLLGYGTDIPIVHTIKGGSLYINIGGTVARRKDAKNDLELMFGNSIKDMSDDSITMFTIWNMNQERRINLAIATSIKEVGVNL